MEVETSAWEPSNHTAPLPVIWSLLGRHIAFHRRLFDLTGSVKAALLLSQSIYWTRHGRDVSQCGGWFHKTTQQWTWETGLSLREQTGARDALKGLSLVQENRLGVPARVYFRVDMETLRCRLSDRFAADPQSAHDNDRVRLAEMLGPSVAYHRVLAGVSGSVHAGLMLSRALYRTRQQAARNPDAWICNSTARWSEDIGLTRREQENARRELVRIGIWEEAVRGIPSGLVARIRPGTLLALLTADAQSASRDACSTAAPVCGNATYRFVQNVETSMGKPHILVSTKPPSQYRQKRQSICIKSTCDLVQTPLHSAREANAQGTVDGVVDAAGGGGGGLIFPDRMLAQERAAAHMLLRPCADQAQAILDELGARLQADGVRGSPLAYLRGLIAREKAGTFTSELGLPIAVERRQSRLAAEQRSAREAEERRQAAQRATPEYQARVRAQREKLSQMRDDMKQRMVAGQPRS